MDVAPKKAFVFPYEYDFGDSWDHQITVEDILEPSTGATRKAECLGGARACPPEDCGGLGGYADLLKILKSPRHREHKSMKEWLGRPFDSEFFDIEAANVCLRKLTWPHVSISQLASILSERDAE